MNSIQIIEREMRSVIYEANPKVTTVLMDVYSSEADGKEERSVRQAQKSKVHKYLSYSIDSIAY